MLASVAVALALALAAPGPHRAPARRSATPTRASALAGASAQNVARARRGLLPRKRRRFVLRAPPPVWLEEPDPPVDAPALAVAAAPVVPEEVGDGAVHGALEGAHVEILLVHRRTGGEGGPLVEATVEGALVEAVLLRRGEPASP